MSVATTAAICPCCGTEFERRRSRQVYCRQQCARDAVKISLEVPAVKKSRNRPKTDSEFDDRYTRIRKELDSKPAQPNDLHWRRADIAEKLARGWTIGQLARYYKQPLEEMAKRVEVIGEEHVSSLRVL